MGLGLGLAFGLGLDVETVALEEDAKELEYRVLTMMRKSVGREEGLMASM